MRGIQMGKSSPPPPTLMLTSYVAGGHTSYLCTYALYGSVHNVFDACRYITMASGRGLGPLEIKSFLGTVKWHRVIGECHFGPKKLKISRAGPLPLAQVMDLPSSKISMNWDI
jgi:hypothetical protein